MGDLGLQQNIGVGVDVSAHLCALVSLIQKNSIELDYKIQEEITSNVALEEDSELPDDTVSLEEYVKTTQMENMTSARNRDKDDLIIENVYASDTYDEIERQVSMLKCSEKIRNIVSVLTQYCLDEHGFMSLPLPPEILPDFCEAVNNYILGVIDEEGLPSQIAEAIGHIRGMQPNGIGYRNMRESFIAQAGDVPGFPDIAMHIIMECFDDLVALRYGTIANLMGKRTDEIVDIVHNWIKILNPYPIVDKPNTPTKYIIPEVSAHMKNGRVVVGMTSHGKKSRRIHLSKMYIDLMNDKSTDSTTKQFISNSVFRAKTLITNLKYRESTIEAVAKFVAKRQQKWFLTGNDGDIEPLYEAEIADALGIHASTVCRCMLDKYIETDYGTVELRKFVKNNAVYTGGVSGNEVIDRIREIIDSEDKTHPLSDQAITDILVAEGKEVSRRVVAKYREEKLHILTSSKRRSR